MPAALSVPPFLSLFRVVLALKVYYTVYELIERSLFDSYFKNTKRICFVEYFLNLQ